MTTRFICSNRVLGPIECLPLHVLAPGQAACRGSTPTQSLAKAGRHARQALALDMLSDLQTSMCMRDAAPPIHVPVGRGRRVHNLELHTL
eukprot:278602-Chlamydomonas_euryale.AAC.2